MDMPLLLARFWGLFLVAICGSLLVNKESYAGFVERFNTEEIVFLYSLMAVIMGALSVAIQNSWTLDYDGFITLLGWGALIKGFLGLLLPRASQEFVDRLTKHWSIVFSLLVLFLVLGIWLLLVGLQIKIA